MTKYVLCVVVSMFPNLSVDDQICVVCCHQYVCNSLCVSLCMYSVFFISVYLVRVYECVFFAYSNMCLYFVCACVSDFMHVSVY